MDHQSVFRLRATLLFAVLSPALSLHNTAYFKLGGSVTLTLPKSSTPITGLSWKLNGNLVVEWVHDMVDLEFYGPLKDVAEVNVVSGELRIHNMTRGHKGVYAVEINNKLASTVFKVEVVKDLRQPEVAVQPLSCSSNSDVCNLNCHGDASETGPVTFYWKQGDGEWTQTSAVLTISNQEESKRPKTYACRMVNPVSQSDSKPISDPFSRVTVPDDGVWIIVGAILGTIFCLGMISVGVMYCYRDREPFRGWLGRLSFMGGNGDASPKRENEESFEVSESLKPAGRG